MGRARADGERAGMQVEGAAAYHRFDQRTAHGGVGDPRPSTAAAGKAMLDASVDDVVRTVLSIRAAK